MAPKQTKPEKYQQIPTQELDDHEASTSESSTLIHEQHRDEEDHEIESAETVQPLSNENPLTTQQNPDVIEIEINEQPLIPSSSEAHTSSRHDQPAILPVSNDGVFANIPAKPTPEVTKNENLPSYEEASRDSAPAYYGNAAILAPGGGDEYFVEGLPVGNIFSFLWSMLVSMCFQFIGFLLTYLLHTSHASKNGSTAGLGFTLIQFGFYLRGKAYGDESFDDSNSTDDTPVGDGDIHSVWLSYLMMIIGWFLVIRSTSEYIRVRKLEATMLTTPEGVV
ncbi:hypothetical protein K7432_006343 [Basidiobolus ranarum]|uniref:Metal homeostatis protein BSD2 n=1 Tax=Basidiobolus ranarum TaxID=34480 RepID=A0ABR2W1R5_9FUNG